MRGGASIISTPSPPQACAFATFSGRNVATARTSGFAGARLSAKAARVASRKSAVAAKAKVRRAQRGGRG